MTCYHPLKAFRTPSGVVFQELSREDIIGDIELPCGQCIGCRLRRASDWALRCMHEAKSHEASCVVALTYGRDALPPDGGLCHRDFQLFLKRLRKHFAPTPIRFYMCGEYGDENHRPHYHACLFGVDFRSDRVQAGKSNSGELFYDSPLLAKLWGYGRVSVQDLTVETAGYVARYVMKKVLGPDAKQAYINPDGVVLRPPYAAMSLKPGIGARWFARYGRDVFPNDFVVAKGRENPTPKYYTKLFKRSGSVQLDEVLHSRELKARDKVADNTPERRVVRERVAEARMRDFKRSVG